MCLPLLLQCLLNHWCRPHCLDCVALCLDLEGFLLSVLLVEKKRRGQYQTPIMPQRRVKKYTRETCLLKWKAICQCFVGSHQHQAFLSDCNAKHVNWHQMLPVSVENIVAVDVMFAPYEFPTFSVEGTILVSRTSLWNAPENMQLTTTTSPAWGKGGLLENVGGVQEQRKSPMCLLILIVPLACSLLYKQRISAWGQLTNGGNGVSER